jgi:hypothetical protein
MLRSFYMGLSKGYAPLTGVRGRSPRDVFNVWGFQRGLRPFDGSSRAEPSRSFKIKKERNLSVPLFLCYAYL